MRKFVIILSALLATACSSSDGDSTVECSIEGQKQFVLDAMRDWYFWNDRLPAQVDLSQFATPEDLLEFLKTFSPTGSDGLPVDTSFSFITTAAADDARFSQGEFEGYGIVLRYIATDRIQLAKVFANGPAGAAGFGRGQEILSLNGRTIAEIDAAEGVTTLLGTSPVTFSMRRLDGSEFEVSVARGTVTIDPVPQWRIIDAGGGRNIGYLELASFILPAEPAMETVFAAFNDAGVNDVIIDLRYNGGGLLSTSNLLGDYFGGEVAENLIFSKTLFNANRSAANDSIEFFDRLLNSLSLSRLVAITASGTASASELVINGMEPHVETVLVGSNTFGKPVGQVGLEFCGNLLRAVAFETVNADDVGGYFDGLPADCAADDDLSIPVGAASDPNLVAAETYLATGACPVAASPQAQAARIGGSDDLPQVDRRGPPAREFLRAF
jgi:hypothetical protein